MLESARVAAISSLALIAIGCGPAKTRADVSLTLGDVSGDGSEVVVHASGKVCDDKLDIRLEVHGSTIVASGRGVVPDNEFGYCDRYIDTGGEGRSRHDVSESIRLDPGTYSVRNVDSTSAIEFKLDSGVITSSFPYATLAEAADVASERIALGPARVATIAAADEIDRFTRTRRAGPLRRAVRLDR